MKTILIEKVLPLSVPATVSLIGFVFLSWWITTDPVKHLNESIPGMDNRSAEMAGSSETVIFDAYFELFEGVPAENSLGSWPRFRGRYFDNISREETEIPDSWGETGPTIVWSQDLGEGFAAPVAANGRVYILDYDEERKMDMLRCFSLADGKEIWRRGYEIHIKRNHGMSRTIPAVGNDVVVTIGPLGQVMCVNAETGDFLWGIDLHKEYEAEIPLWYTGQCPLIDDSMVVVAPGGKALMIGIDCKTGDVIWETPNQNNWKMSHSSIMPMTFANTKMYVYPAIGGIVGVSAEGETLGSILWETAVWSPQVIAPAPLVLDDGKIFFSASYGAGSAMLQVVKEGEQFTVDTLGTYTPKEGFSTEQQTPIYYQGYLFGILPKDAGALRTEFACYHPDDLTQLVWSSGKENRFGLGPFILADGKFFILDDVGVLTVAEANTRAYNQLAQYKILDGQDSWGPMAIVNGRLLLRDSKKMVCIDLNASS
ncbi:PQQ-like beta-propeller repeat protein [bacterium]|nr:PQQ-like beta-propeller repeat protein [bacterium]